MNNNWEPVGTISSQRALSANSFAMLHAFCYKPRFFSTQPQGCLTFSWIELQMLLRYCLIHIIIMILRHFLYLLCLFPCLDIRLFMSYLCDLFFIFIFIFIKWLIIWSHEYRLLFCLFFRVRPIIFGWKCRWRMWIAFAWFFANFRLALLVKVLLIKKACIFIKNIPRENGNF